MSEQPNFINQSERVIDFCVQKANDTERPLLLIGGDMSGIQPFLYHIVSSKAAKNLRGRSCYIDLLGRAVVQALLGALGLKRDHIVCETGGTFVLIAPNSPDVVKALDGAIAFVEEKLFLAHGTEISIAIDAVSITVAEAKGGTDTLAQCWNELFAKREAKKNAKFARLLSADDAYSRFFTPQAVNGDRRDAITGEDIVGKVCHADDVGDVTEINEEIFKLGEKLREGKKPIMIYDQCPARPDDEFTICPAGLGITFALRNLDNSKPDKTFEKLLENNEDSLQRLGILRMDVDSLGAKFQQCAREQSLAAYAKLSYELGSFFSGKVKELCDEKGCQLLYGGGDDLFVVGQWNKTIELAEEINSKFKEWAKGREGEWSLSAGVAIVKAKYPIIEGAQESGDEEDNAKCHRCDGVAKQSISFMGMPMNWEKEFTAVKVLKEKLVEMVDNGRLPKAFLQNVMRHVLNGEFVDHCPTNVSIYWHLAYDIKRAAERAPKEHREQVAELLRNLQTESYSNSKTLVGTPVTTSYHLLELWALAARWAELQCRTNNNQ